MSLTSNTILYKQPTEVIIYAMDFSNWLASTTTLSSPAVTINPTGPTLGTPAVSGQQITVQISGGTAGTNYRVQITVTTSLGETLVGDGILQVRDR